MKLDRPLIAVAVTLTALVLVNSVVAYYDDRLYKRVVSGQYKLSCDTGKGLEPIAPEKIVGKVEDTWLFTENGYAKACKVKKK